MSKEMRMLRWAALICCFGRKRRSSTEEIFSFSVTSWDPCELERVRTEDVSCLFSDDISMDGGCRDIEVVAMVHRAEDNEDLLEEMDHPGGGEDDGRGDNNRGPPGDDQGGESHTTLHRDAEKQQGVRQGLAEQGPGQSIPREQEHPGILRRPVDHADHAEILEEPVGVDEQGSDSTEEGDHARLLPPTSQVKEVVLQACRLQKVHPLLLSGHQHRGPAAVPLIMSLGRQKILLQVRETCLI